MFNHIAQGLQLSWGLLGNQSGNLSRHIPDSSQTKAFISFRIPMYMPYDHYLSRRAAFKEEVDLWECVTHAPNTLSYPTSSFN